MKDYQKHFIKPTATVRQALEQLNNLSPNAICFVVNDQNILLGSITDGDVRRGIINGSELEDQINPIIQQHPKALHKHDLTPDNFSILKEKRIDLVPILNDEKQIIDIINLENYISLLPLEAVIMAGGKGTRLRPLTLDTPKPLLKVGNKPIIEHMIDRLIKFGIRTVYISVNYLGEQLEEYFGDGSEKGISIKYIWEDEFLGTAGALKLNKEGYNSEYLLFMNSDLLTNIDFNDMFHEIVTNNGEMVVGTVPYEVKVPYGVIETTDGCISALKEKPTYTYYSNAGIYMVKTKYIDEAIPENEFFNATDLIEHLMQDGKRVLNFPIRSYWLDIGKPHDFEKAQEDIKHIKL